MPFNPVTAALMYRGVYTIPELLREHSPTQLPEDEIEGDGVVCWIQDGTVRIHKYQASGIVSSDVHRRETDARTDPIHLNGTVHYHPASQF